MTALTQLIGGEGRAQRAVSPSAVDTSFTLATGGAAQAQLYDGNDATPAADPGGLTASTHAAYDFGAAKSIARMRAITASANGFGASIVFAIQYSDTGLASGFTTANTITVNAGTAQLSDKQIGDFGAHRYWRIIYQSGTTGGNAWLGELTFYERY
ncbi:hypothetical protein [Bradyrhizobium zhanjiangense]|uniref:hypothetical protein n=1 Tax=Bradyrhizobium zhanjiangense TaxID=1325107 RepID=UPI001008D902|nr:hypothetical protein [Bradyrhizobium zhanjiangense]